MTKEMKGAITLLAGLETFIDGYGPSVRVLQRENALRLIAAGLDAVWKAANQEDHADLE